MALILIQVRVESMEDVKNISNHLYSLQTNLDSVYNALKTVRHYNITPQCKEKVVRYLLSFWSLICGASFSDQL